MIKLPIKIQKEIKKAVQKKADAHGYMHQDRIQNGIFMENLLKDPDVGIRLSDFMGKAELKTYIKDAIINRYAKERIASELSLDLVNLIRKIYGQNSEKIESSKDKRLSFHSLSNGEYLIVSGGTLVKWETALRKALEFIAKAPGLPPKDTKLSILIVLAPLGQSLTESDRNFLNDALGFLGIKVAIMENP